MTCVRSNEHILTCKFRIWTRHNYFFNKSKSLVRCGILKVEFQAHFYTKISNEKVRYLELVRWTLLWGIFCNTLMDDDRGHVGCTCLQTTWVLHVKVMAYNRCGSDYLGLLYLWIAGRPSLANLSDRFLRITPIVDKRGCLLLSDLPNLFG